MKLKKIAVTGILTGMMLLSHAAPVLAAGANYTPVAGGSASFDKYLVMDAEANVPNQTFNFTIQPAQEGMQASNGMLAVYPGNTQAVTGAPVIREGQAAFHEGDPTFASVQNHADTGTQQATQPKDSVTLQDGEKYARKQVSVDFSGVRFSEPGVYRWVITEAPSNAKGITNDADTTRNLDVYVVDNNGALEIEGYVIHNDDGFQPAVSGAAHEPSTGKSVGFTNRYTTYNINLSKTVTGNQGSRDEYFRFTVRIQGDVEGTKLDVDLSQADARTLVNAYSPESHENPSELVLGPNGTCEQDFWLQSGQTITINGIPAGAAYTIDEAASDYKTTTSVKEGSGETVRAEGRSVADSDLEGDTNVDFVNDKTGVIPTNLIVKTAPFAALAMIGLAGVLVITVRRRRCAD